jgi:repressor LexA
VLKPENKAYPVIRPKGELEIFAVVVGQFRLSACDAQAGKYR